MKQETGQAFVFPDPVALVAVADEAGDSNLITLAWVGMACSEPVHVTIAVRPQRYSNELLKAAGEFTLNIPSADLVERVDYCGVGERPRPRQVERGAVHARGREAGGARRSSPSAATRSSARSCRSSRSAPTTCSSRACSSPTPTTPSWTPTARRLRTARPARVRAARLLPLGDQIYGYGQSLRDRKAASQG